MKILIDKSDDEAVFRIKTLKSLSFKKKAMPFSGAS
jgi:hypothetical protein